MQQQPSQQRIRGGAQPRAHSRTSSKASSTAENARKAGLAVDVPQPGLNTELDSNGRPSPALSFSGPSSQTNGDSRAGANAAKRAQPAGETAMPSIGFPPRPAQYAQERTTLLWQADSGSSGQSKSETRSQTFEPPAESIVYPHGKSADYNPWMGNHPEDTLSEQTVKLGWSNKPAITNEANTARPSLWAQLKNKAGIQTLSSLFVAVLEKRQASGRLQTPSTFKPPPRVSLTNTKREAWLSDLANPACALRRFNRTIPYGINGKGLLEQCLTKEIPTARAIWLAKCIGANELRTLKRKGVTGALGISAELKWIREWTIHVEQFIDSTVAAPDEQAWKEKVQYVVRLAYHLYIEQLLDQDHYLDWILSSLESSTTERLPLWIAHVQLYWKFLVCARKRGRRLAETVCHHLQAIGACESAADLMRPVCQKLQLVLNILTMGHRSCLIMPKRWSKFEGLLRCLSPKAELRKSVENVVERNNRLAKPLWDQDSAPNVSSKRRVLDTLDGIALRVSIPEICDDLTAVLSSPEQTVMLVLEWSSSFYRQGVHRVYLASRILRRCGALGVDIESSILSFVLEPPNAASLNIHNVVKIVAELVRSNSFAVLKVFRTVIARGAMTDTEHNPLAASRLRKLVRGIPTIGLPQHVEDLQRNLLRDSTSPGALKNDDLPKRLFDQMLESNSPTLQPISKELRLDLEAMTVADRFKLTLHIRRQMQRFSWYDQQSISPLTCQKFCFTREVLEAVEDLPILADIVGICIRNGNSEILESAVDTINYHSRCFAAIGALRPLTTHALERYHIFRDGMQLQKSCVASIISLLETDTAESDLMHQLRYDLARFDQHNQMAMSSPASDNALDIMAGSMESEEEIERILSSGTTMDEQSVGRVFQRLTAHLTSSPKTQTRANWFSRLRAFDETTFDGLMQQWLPVLLGKYEIKACRRALQFLLGSDALSTEVLESTVSMMQEHAQDDADMQIKLTCIALSAFLSPCHGDGGENDMELYKCRLRQRQLINEKPALVESRVLGALDILSDDSMSPYSEELRAVLNAESTHQFVLQQAISRVAASKDQKGSKAFQLPVSREGNIILKRIVEDLLTPNKLTQQATVPDQDQIPQLMRMVDELSLPLCQLNMRLLLQGNAKSAESAAEMATPLFEAIMRGPESDRPAWLDLIDGLDANVMHRLRHMAEMQVLKIVNECLTRVKGDASQSEQLQKSKVKPMLRRLLYIVDCTVAPASPTHAAPHALESESSTLDRFGPVRELLARHFSPDADGKIEMSRACEMTSAFLSTLLHLLVVRKLASEGQRNGPADVAMVLPLLFSILTHVDFNGYQSTIELLFDTAAYLSDDLTDEYRSSLVKAEGTKYPDDPRIAFILGPTNNPDAWLGLVTTNNVPVPASAPPPPTPAARFGGNPQQGNPRFQQLQRPPTPQQRMGGQPAQLKSFNAPVPFPIRRWELLPDQGSSGTANDTAISLSLVGARKA